MKPTRPGDKPVFTILIGIAVPGEIEVIDDHEIDFISPEPDGTLSLVLARTCDGRQKTITVPASQWSKTIAPASFIRLNFPKSD